MRRLLAALVNGHRRHPAQSLLLIAGLALSVAVVVAIDLTIVSARDAFGRSQRLLSGQASHQVRSEAGDIDQGLYARIRQEFDLRQAAPVIEGSVRELGSGQRLRVLGVDPIAEAAFRPWLLRGLGAARSSSQAGALPALLGRPDAVLLSAPLAERFGLDAGDTLRLRTRGERVALTVAGVIPAQLAPQGSEDLLLLDIAAAQALLAMPGRLSRIDLNPGADPDRDGGLTERLAAALPAGVSLVAGAERDAGLAQISRAFETNLRALSLLALLVGVFLVFQTLSFLSLRRRGLIGLWRALGVSRGELARLFLSEAAALGALAGLVGIGLGLWLAGALLESVARTYNDLYFRVTIADITVSPWVLSKAMTLAVLGALVAVALPLRDALRVPPLANLRQLPQAGLSARRIRRGLWPALALLAAGGLMLRFGPPDLAFAFMAIFVMLSAALGLIPWCALTLLDGVQRWAGSRLAVLPSLLLSSVRFSLGRTGIALAALTLAIATLIGMSSMIHSFRLSVSAWVERSLRADLYVSAEDGAALPDDLIGRIAGLPGVDALSQSRRRSLMTDAGPLTVLGLDLPRAGFDGYTLLQGDPARAWEQFRAGEVFVSEPLANRLRLGVGDNLRLPAAGGEVGLPIAGVYRDYASAQGVAALALDRYRALYDDPAVNALGVYAEPSRLAQLEAAIASLLAGHDGIDLVSAASIRDRTMQVFARTFAVTDLLRLLAALIAVVAVLGALLALQIERLREHALLRALGLDAAQMARLQLGQAGLLGLLAALLALPLGAAMAWLLIEVINRRAFGWSMALELPSGQIAVAVALAVISALIAGWLPARRAARLRLASTLREQPL